MNPVGYKQRRGDKHTPEGIYSLDYRINHSKYHKPVRISYPNAKDKDKKAAKDRDDDPGDNIFIHGMPLDAVAEYRIYADGEWTDGCIAVTNDDMDEIWELVPEGTQIEFRP
jgi:murein L,D-transpeptidase YafK